MEEKKTLTPIVVPRSEHCLSRKNIDPDALKVMLRLHRHGYKAYLVGGSVRDLLMERRPKDFDVSTDARPGQIRKLFNNCRIIGRRFRLAHIYFRGNKIIEVSTFRKAPPILTPGEDQDPGDPTKAGDNTFGQPYEDALRRDLTINGLFYDIGSFSILDYVGGMEDLKAGILRTIGSADERFQEDPMRMLRIVRYAVRTGFKIQPETYEAVRRCASFLEGANRFRLQDEVQKDLEDPAFHSVLRLQWELGLLAVIFPELNAYMEGAADSPQVLFRPSWVWDALKGLDASENTEKDLRRERRVMSMVLPLVEYRAMKTHASLVETRKDPGAFKDLFGEVQTPFAVPRREQERFRMDLAGWMRLLEFIEQKQLIPASYQKKAYFDRVVNWHLFYHRISGKKEEETREALDAAVRAGQTRHGRPRRKRKKRLRRQGKPLDFS